RERVGAAKMIRGVRREGRQRILPFDPSFAEVVGPARTEDNGSMRARTNEHPADVGMLAQGRQELRVALVDFLHGQPPLLLHQVHESEVARAEDDYLLIRDVVLRLLLVAFLRAPPRPPPGRGEHGLPLAAPAETADLAFVERALDELVEAVPVALLEGRALRLAVVGEDDDLVGTR